MKKIVIIIDNELLAFYKDIADAANRTVEDIICDTLYKTKEILLEIKV